MPSSHNSLCQQFRSFSSEARASPDHLRFTISSESPKAALKPLMDLEVLATMSWASDLN